MGDERKKLHNADTLDKVMGTQVDIFQLLNIFGEQAMRAMPLRSKKEIERLRNDIIDDESAKASIFQIGTVS
ncbi:hypothetical protein Y032_0504g2649 [Ancylostoma ceylanicum]|uniref:Uncharacterized protein n=1 Tax=Ancylostoma ceylanicum TaxID=53326 RepID=A0A016WVR2_9BILA|nr:hypothetical protein Y032_0504g2649 [Ancylostoma ceylanicum]